LTEAIEEMGAACRHCLRRWSNACSNIREVQHGPDVEWPGADQAAGARRWPL